MGLLERIGPITLNQSGENSKELPGYKTTRKNLTSFLKCLAMISIDNYLSILNTMCDVYLTV